MAIEQEIVTWLKRHSKILHLQDTPGREAFLSEAGLDDLQNMLKLEGDAVTFCNNLVQQLRQYGALPDGLDPLVAVLEAAKTMVGLDKQAECDALIACLHAAGRAADSPRTNQRQQRKRILIVIALVILLIGIIAVSYHLATRSRDTRPNPDFATTPIAVPTVPTPVLDPTQVIVPPYLRSRSETVSIAEAKKIFNLDENMRPLKYLTHNFENKDEVVLDHATGLMWQKKGSSKPMPYIEIEVYIQELNRQKFAGYNDWRLPTIPELMSLLKPERQPNGKYIDPIFDDKQWACWSADKVYSNREWSVNFDFGTINHYSQVSSCYVRSVRSGQSKIDQ